LLTGNLNAQTPSHAALIEGAKKEGKLSGTLRWRSTRRSRCSTPFRRTTRSYKAEARARRRRAVDESGLERNPRRRWLFDAISTAAMSVVADRHMVAPYLTPERDAFISEFKRSARLLDRHLRQ